MTKRCLICEKEVVVSDLGPSDATIWTSPGNYGSAVYDPLREGAFLEALVCDKCLLQKRALVEEVRIRHPEPLVERRAPDF
jgi:hypothetical protein